MPVSWEHLPSPNESTIYTVLDILDSEGDAWAEFATQAAELHDKIIQLSQNAQEGALGT